MAGKGCSAQRGVADGYGYLSLSLISTGLRHLLPPSGYLQTLQQRNHLNCPTLTEWSRPEALRQSQLAKQAALFAD